MHTHTQGHAETQRGKGIGSLNCGSLVNPKSGGQAGKMETKGRAAIGVHR